jgi:hypothetical protein
MLCPPSILHIRPLVSLVVFELVLTSHTALAADHVIHVSVDGLNAGYFQTLASGDTLPNFARLLNEGAYTYNARTDYTHTITLPNHTSMLTGRPVSQPTGLANTLHHGWTSNADPAPTATLHNSGNLNVPYKASTFDVVHDAGLSTAQFASKHKFVIYEQSYNERTGAPHAIFRARQASPCTSKRYRRRESLEGSGMLLISAQAITLSFLADSR